MGILDHCEASSSSFNFLANFLASCAKTVVDLADVHTVHPKFEEV